MGSKDPGSSATDPQQRHLQHGSGHQMQNRVSCELLRNCTNAESRRAVCRAVDLSESLTEYSEEWLHDDRFVKAKDCAHHQTNLSREQDRHSKTQEQR